MSKGQFLSALLKSFGENGKQDPIGRSLARCYGFALQHDPKLQKAILGEEVVKVDREEEWVVRVDPFTFRGKKKGRRADIYITYQGSPKAIVEIKVNDQDPEDSDEQLKDYINHCEKKPGLKFFYITKNPMGPKEKQLIDRLPGCAFHRRHFEIRDRLSETKDNPVANMIANYLEDQGMSGFRPLKNINNQDLKRLSLRFLPMKTEGFGKTHSKNNAHVFGSIISQCLNNITEIGEWLRDGNEDKFLRPFIIYPSVSPYWKVGQLIHDRVRDHTDENKPVNISKLPSQLKRAIGKEDEIKNDYCEGGIICFCAERQIGASPVWLYVSIWIELDKTRKKSSLKTGMEIEFWSNGQQIANDYANWDLERSEDETKTKLSALLKNAQGQLQKNRKHQKVAAMKFPGLKTHGR